jgi:translation initiation factor 5A
MEFTDIKKGCHIVMNDNCVVKVVDVTFCKPGKHGGAKKVTMGVDVITDAKYIETFTHHTILKPFEIYRNKYLVMYIDEDGYLFLLVDNGEEKNDVKVTEKRLWDDITLGLEKEDELNIEILTTIVEEITRTRILGVW